MREVVFHEFGAPSVMRLVQQDHVPPASGEVSLRVLACGFNHLDLDLRRGISRFPLEFPHRLGREIVGIVEDVDGIVEDVTPGMQVLVLPVIPCQTCEDCQSGRENLCKAAIMPGINVPGGYSEYVNVPARGVLPLSAEQDPILAAATPIAYGTAWRMLVTLAEISQEETVLINGATGGLGTALVHIAALRGAKVVGSTGFDEKKEYVLEQGADLVINHRKADLVQEVLRFTEGRGVDVAVDSVGGDILRKTLACMAPQGRVITAGGHGGEVVPLDVIHFFRQELQLFGSRSQTRAELKTVMKLLRKKEFRPHIHRTFNLQEVVAAHELLESRQFTGKMVLCP